MTEQNTILLNGTIRGPNGIISARDDELSLWSDWVRRPNQDCAETADVHGPACARLSRSFYAEQDSTNDRLVTRPAPRHADGSGYTQSKLYYDALKYGAQPRYRAERAGPRTGWSSTSKGRVTPIAVRGPPAALGRLRVRRAIARTS